MSQSNVKFGPVTFPCGEDLTAASDHLAVLTHNLIGPWARLPSNQDDLALYLILEGAAADEAGYFLPLSPAANVRLPLIGSCLPGDKLVLADPSVEGQAGKVTVLPGAAGTYRVVAIAEEKAVADQLVLARPANLGTITIS
ncbi:hypothetical protein [Tichowtungia aerotolerans]|uniref:Uncharacterized protein n=1 Tax=Tichowtungia aerotolerans TaxID=2697043 RepID=A0A6P1MEL6_9BACT|nr:hypothetical protein [Tichowtungia aerotolerans]QHI70478.1 hypothetical protein GT409_13865 [Tichowtungia aerotolerans]